MIETSEPGVNTDSCIPHILRRADDIERIIELVVSQADHARALLGTDIPRSVHQLVLMNRLIHMGLAVDPAPALCKPDSSAGQSRSVIAVCGCLLVECHAESDDQQFLLRRLRHDVYNSRYATGLLIAFDRTGNNGAVTRVMSGQFLH